MPTGKKTTKSARKKAPVKRVRKTTKRETAPKKTTKTAKKPRQVKKRAVREKQGKIVIHDGTKKQNIPAKQTVSNRVQLALLSPFRLPIPHDQFVTQTARVVGFTFIIAGAVFACINLFQVLAVSTGDDTKTQTAAMVCSSSDGTCTTSTTTSTSDSTVGTITTIQNTQPVVTTTIDATSPIHGKVTITYTVTKADSVDAAVFYEDSQRYIKLGHAHNIGGDTWEYAWDTTRYADGQYRIESLIANAYGGYEDTADSFVEVANHASATTTNTSTSSTTDTIQATNTNVTPDTSVTEPTARISVAGGSLSSGSATLAVSVASAELVHLAAVDNSTHEVVDLGDASYTGDETWEFHWNTSNVAHDDYTVYAKITNQYGSYRDGSVSLAYGVTDSTQNVTTDTAPTLLASTTDPIRALVPPITLSVPDQNAMFRTEHITVGVSSAEFIEMYATPNYGLTPHFLGLAQKQSDGSWLFRMDTTQLPNGAYDIFARVKNSFGLYESGHVHVTILNKVAPTNTTFEQKVYISLAQDAERTIQQSLNTAADSVKAPSSTELSKLDALENNLVSSNVQATGTRSFLDSFRAHMKGLMEELATANRNKDDAKITEIKQQIASFKEKTLTDVKSLGLSKKLTQEITDYFVKVESALQKAIANNETIIKNRVGDKVLNDSDQDGISDYDEINIYHTDPFNADTDGDGFIDGAEVLNNFDPTNQTSEALVQYESPKQFGVVRNDILKVNSITTIKPDKADTVSDGVRPVAMISGVGLPNSYVTLYVFSTPIVITVRTGDDGSWSYTFDKELPDGQHQIYEAITDNAGRIVAKSDPLNFVKTAEAFTQTDAKNAAESAPTTSQEPSFLSSGVLLAMLSVMVVVFGLVLLLLGMHVQNKQPKAVL